MSKTSKSSTPIPAKNSADRAPPPPLLKKKKKMSAETYLVTGAAGFIGAEIARQLLNAGANVVGVDNLNDYYDTALKHARLKTLHNPGAKNSAFRFYPGDIEDRDFIARLFVENTFSAVLNLAGRAGVRHSMENPFVYMTTNVLGTLNLLETMRRRDVKKFVLASTSSLYAGHPLPFVETLPVNTPNSPDAASKKAAEITAYTFHKLYGIDVSVLRYFTVFGPAGRPDMAIYRFIQNIATNEPIEIYGDGSQTRDFTYVEDIARGTIAALKPLGYEIINLGGGEKPFSINETIAFIEEKLNRKAIRMEKPKNKADMTTTAADISKAKHLLDWQPQTPFPTALEKTIAWHKTQLQE
jgi:nucleoside-diphosphate-sugar epimerase